MKWIYMVCLGIFLSMTSFSYAEDQIRKDIFSDRWELKQNGETKIYFRKSPWWSNRWKVKDATTHETVGEVRYNYFLKQYEYQGRE